MVITDIKESCYSKMRMRIFIDCECAFSLYKSDIKKNKLQVGMEIDEAFLKALLSGTVLKNAFDDSYRVIARCDCSAKMLRDKLALKDYPYEIVNTVISEFKDKHYIDDYDYGKKFARDAFLNKGKGKSYIEMELYKKGISRDIIEEVISLYENDSRILEVAEKKLNSLMGKREKPEYKDFEKLSSYLFRRGFPYDEIKSIKERLKEKYE